MKRNSKESHREKAKKMKMWNVLYVAINFRTIREKKNGLDAPRASDDATSCGHLYHKLTNFYVIFI